MLKYIDNQLFSFIIGKYEEIKISSISPNSWSYKHDPDILKPQKPKSICTIPEEKSENIYMCIWHTSFISKYIYNINWMKKLTQTALDLTFK